MNFKELTAKSTEDLHSELLQLSREAFNLRMQKGAGQLSRPSQVKTVRRDIARIKTLINQRRGEQAT